MIPITLFIDDADPINTTLEDFLANNAEAFDDVERAQIRTQVVLSRGVYIGDCGVPFAVHGGHHAAV